MTRDIRQELRSRRRLATQHAALGTVIALLALSLSGAWAQEAGTGGVPEPTQVPVPTPPTPTPEASAAPAPAPLPPSGENRLVSLSGLLMQPPYLAVRVGVALLGALTSGVVWVIPGENNRQNAQAVWDKTVRYYWGWPEFVGALGGAN